MQYAHCFPLVKRNGMQIVGLFSVPRENYRRNKQKNYIKCGNLHRKEQAFYLF